MLTRCPNCHTLFRISDSQLRSARGKTRCGQCFTIFEAQEEITEENQAQAAGPAPSQPANPPAAPQTQPPVSAPPDPAPSHGSNVSKMGNAASSIYNELVIKNRSLKYDIPDTLDAETDSQAPDYSITGSNPQPSSVTATQGYSAYDGLATQSPAPVAPRPPTPAAGTAGGLAPRPASGGLRNPLQRRNATQDFNFVPDVLQDDLYEEVDVPSAKSNILLISSILLLLLVLILQFAYFMRASLARNETIRPMMVKFCKVFFNCDIPYRKNIKKIKMVTFTVDMHPKKKRVGVINSRFVNNATYIQPYPVVELKVKSKLNKLIAMRRLQPKDYLPKHRDIKKGFEPNTPIDLKVEFEIPTKEPPSISLTFR